MTQWSLQSSRGRGSWVIEISTVCYLTNKSHNGRQVRVLIEVRGSLWSGHLYLCFIGESHWASSHFISVWSFRGWNDSWSLCCKNICDGVLLRANIKYIQITVLIFMFSHLTYFLDVSFWSFCWAEYRFF